MTEPVSIVLKRYSEKAPVSVVKDLHDQKFPGLPRSIRLELTLSVEVEALIWLKDGQEVDMADQRLKLTHVGPTYELVIEGVTEADMGQYEVVYDVKNNSRTSASLILERKSVVKKSCHHPH